MTVSKCSSWCINSSSWYKIYLEVCLVISIHFFLFFYCTFHPQGNNFINNLNTKTDCLIRNENIMKFWILSDRKNIYFCEISRADLLMITHIYIFYLLEWEISYMTSWFFTSKLFKIIFWLSMYRIKKKLTVLPKFYNSQIIFYFKI